MELWVQWWMMLWELRPACARLKTFFWLAVCVAGISIRTDLLGVTSIIRAMGIDKRYYTRLLDTFHNTGINLERLTVLWATAVIRWFAAHLFNTNGRIVLVGDGIKIPKRGKKMPGVKLLHQQSDSNTKPEYIMGHSFQAIALLVHATKSVFAVPLVSRIHEGIISSNRDKRTLHDKLVDMVATLNISLPFYIVLDAFYAGRKIIKGMVRLGGHVVVQIKRNSVAYYPVTPNARPKRGRPRKYGKKIPLKSLLKNTSSMEKAKSPVYGEKNVTISFRSIDLLWRPVGALVRFVAVVHPTRGSRLLMCTDLSLDPIKIIRLYGLRFKIELSFKQAVRTIGVYAYHLWMLNMKPLKWHQGNQHLHRETEKYRQQVVHKITAYHRFVQAGIIAQGIMQYLSTVMPQLVWSNFRSWLRTIRPGTPPSEMVVAMALRNTYSDFLRASQKTEPFAKFLTDRAETKHSRHLPRAA